MPSGAVPGHFRYFRVLIHCAGITTFVNPNDLVYENDFACIAAAQMFAMNTNNDTLRVGERNVAAVKMKLSELNIRLLSEDCGLNYGRTVEFYSETGEYVIKSVGKPRKVI